MVIEPLIMMVLIDGVAFISWRINGLYSFQNIKLNMESLGDRCADVRPLQ